MLPLSFLFPPHAQHKSWCFGPLVHTPAGRCGPFYQQEKQSAYVPLLEETSDCHDNSRLLLVLCIVSCTEVVHFVTPLNL